MRTAPPTLLYLPGYRSRKTEACRHVSFLAWARAALTTTRGTSWSRRLKRPAGSRFRRLRDSGTCCAHGVIGGQAGWIALTDWSAATSCDADATIIIAFATSSHSRQGCVNVHNPFSESNPCRRSVPDDGCAIRKRPRQSLLVDIHHHRVARCPGSSRVVHIGVE